MTFYIRLSRAGDPIRRLQYCNSYLLTKYKATMCYSFRREIRIRSSAHTTQIKETRKGIQCRKIQESAKEEALFRTIIC